MTVPFIWPLPFSGFADASFFLFLLVVLAVARWPPDECGWPRVTAAASTSRLRPISDARGDTPPVRGRRPGDGFNDSYVPDDGAEHQVHARAGCWPLRRLIALGMISRRRASQVRQDPCERA